MVENIPVDLAKLQKQLGEDNANAVAEFVDGRISGLRQEVDELANRQQKNIDWAKDDGSLEAAQVVDPASHAVNKARAAVRQAEADPTPEKAAVAKDKVEEASEKVAKTESDLESRVASLEKGQTSMIAQIDGLKVQVRKVGSDDFGRVSLLFAALFGLLLLAYLVIWGFGPYDWKLEEQILWPVIIAGVPAVLYEAYLFWGVRRESHARAHDNAGVAILDEAHASGTEKVSAH